ncbi:hypothetical protein [Xenorhabdus doucetiae]|uniref:Uncharacterized protein n=1 Tax=Xenorhabdus doucetiae TaxID=351671 RepID=A0A068QPA3_9GAMM|nr:hypothetical protein [Xenorhabdus doucetiae]TYP16491.1 hypothetical protein LY16_00346 [Xenorhabdus doucetiae]CDG16852.1 protein of unknown function [Xenorhabdus doucetiae]
MPFTPPFRNQFYIGDLIYGLAKDRQKYCNRVNSFTAAGAHDKQRGNPPIYIDRYLIQREIKPSNNPEYMKDVNYDTYKKDFFGHLKSESAHQYNNVATNPHRGHQCKEEQYIDICQRDVGRKCKGGLSWISTGNSPLVKDIHVHFILDNINMISLIQKKDQKSITGKELRWIFRNKNDPRVAAKIQFWDDGEPTSPPWISANGWWHRFFGDESHVWEEYEKHLQEKAQREDERYQSLAQLFNIP